MLKKTLLRKVGLVAAVLFAVPLYTAPAYAYIDPGTASIVLQSIIGGIAAASLFFRSHIAMVYYKLFPGRNDAGTAGNMGDRAGDDG